MNRSRDLRLPFWLRVKRRSTGGRGQHVEYSRERVTERMTRSPVNREFGQTEVRSCEWNTRGWDPCWSWCRLASPETTFHYRPPGWRIASRWWISRTFVGVRNYPRSFLRRNYRTWNPLPVSLKLFEYRTDCRLNCPRLERLNWVE